jgi:Icc-related predicted phosphoesterase
MKIFAFADSHRYTCATAIAISERLPTDKPSAVVCAGDWANFGWHEPNDMDAIQKLIQTGPPFLFTNGNHESSHNVDRLKKMGGIYLPENSVVIDDVGFYGLPFTWDDRIPPELFNAQVVDCRRLKDQANKFVLVSHAPPAGYFRPWAPRRQDESAMTTSWIYNFMIEMKPALTIVGHLHTGTQPHEMTLDGLRIVNPGCAGVLIDV